MSVLFPEKPGEEPDEQVDQLLPEDDEPLDEDEALEELDAAIEALPDDDLVVTADAPAPIGRSYGFDVHARRFITGPNGHSPIPTYGDGTLRTWIAMTMNTDMGAHPIFSDDYGMEHLGEGFGGPTALFPTGDYEQRIREALTFHPRIVGVRDFEWDLDPADDAVAVDFTVDVDDSSDIRVGVTLSG